jgi:hypothetical protein
MCSKTKHYGARGVQIGKQYFASLHHQLRALRILGGADNSCMSLPAHEVAVPGALLVRDLTKHGEGEKQRSRTASRRRSSRHPRVWSAVRGGSRLSCPERSGSAAASEPRMGASWRPSSSATSAGTSPPTRSRIVQASADDAASPKVANISLRDGTAERLVCSCALFRRRTTRISVVNSSRFPSPLSPLHPGLHFLTGRLMYRLGDSTGSSRKSLFHSQGC